jgi:hypothetical protein
MCKKIIILTGEKRIMSLLQMEIPMEMEVLQRIPPLLLYLRSLCK